MYGAHLTTLSFLYMQMNQTLIAEGLLKESIEKTKGLNVVPRIDTLNLLSDFLLKKKWVTESNACLQEA